MPVLQGIYNVVQHCLILHYYITLHYITLLYITLLCCPIKPLLLYSMIHCCFLHDCIPPQGARVTFNPQPSSASLSTPSLPSPLSPGTPSFLRRLFTSRADVHTEENDACAVLVDKLTVGKSVADTAKHVR